MRRRPTQQEIGAWNALIRYGYPPPDMCGYDLPDAVDAALDCLVRQRDDLVSQVVQLRQALARVASPTPSLSGGVSETATQPKSMSLRWEETFAYRDNGALVATGWEAGEYFITKYFGSDSFGWAVRFGSQMIGDTDDPDRAKAIAQKHFETSVAATPSPQEDAPTPEAGGAHG